MKVTATYTFALACTAAAGLVIAVAGLLVVSQPAMATTQFAKQTGKACGDCHTASAGGGPLTPFGDKFKANGNKLPQ